MSRAAPETSPAAIMASINIASLDDSMRAYASVPRLLIDYIHQLPVGVEQFSLCLKAVANAGRLYAYFAETAADLTPLRTLLRDRYIANVFESLKIGDFPETSLDPYRLRRFTLENLAYLELQLITHIASLEEGPRLQAVLAAHHRGSYLCRYFLVARGFPEYAARKEPLSEALAGILKSLPPERLFAILLNWEDSSTAPLVPLSGFYLEHPRRDNGMEGPYVLFAYLKEWIIGYLRSLAPREQVQACLQVVDGRLKALFDLPRTGASLKWGSFSFTASIPPSGPSTCTRELIDLLIQEANLPHVLNYFRTNNAAVVLNPKVMHALFVYIEKQGVEEQRIIWNEALCAETPLGATSAAYDLAHPGVLRQFADSLSALPSATAAGAGAEAPRSASSR